MTIFRAEIETVGESEGGAVSSYASISKTHLSELFSAIEDSIKLDYGNETPVAVNIVILREIERPANG